MQYLLSTSVFAYLFLSLAGAAAAQDARALLDRAIEAHGGAARLERTKKGHLKARIEGGPWDVASPAELEETFDLPDRYKRTIDGSINGMPKHVEDAVSGNKGWQREGSGPVREYNVREPLPVAQHWHAILAMLLSLHEENIQLTSLPDETKDGRTFAGIRTASQQGLGDLYFDKSTGLLARARRPQPNFMGGQAAIEETLFDDYRDIQGIRYPMKFKIVAGESSSMTVSILSIEFRDKIDDSVFVKPQVPAAEGPVGEAAASESETSSGIASKDREKAPMHWDRVLIVVTAIAGVFIGAVWFIVRASKRGKRDTPPG